jgi:hypothetical protein
LSPPTKAQIPELSIKSTAAISITESLWRSSGTISASCCRRRLPAWESRQFWG